MVLQSKKSFAITGRTIVNNAAFNVIGKIIPLVVGVFSIPFIISKLGIEQFGILSIIWISLTNYFYLFDFGLGQTVTKFVAESLEKGDKKHVSEIIWTSLIINFIFSFLLLIILLPLVPFVVNNVLKLSPQFLDTAKTSFFILVLAFPLTTTFSIVRGILEGAQRYDILNLVKIPFNCFLFLIPVILLVFGFNLPLIVLFLAMSQLFVIFIALFFSFKIFPFLNPVRKGLSNGVKEFFLVNPVRKPRFSNGVNIQSAKKIFNFGKWLTAANFANTLLVAFDRLFIGTLISVEVIGFYSAPFDAVANILLAPAQSLIVLFPVFSALSITRKSDAIFFYTRAFKHLLTIIGIAVIFVIFFASDILNFWLGPEFAQKSALVLQFLAIGMLGICFSAMGDNLIKGYGRPKLLAKIRLAEIIPFFALLVFFTLKFGIAGTAFIWMVRAVIDALLIIFINLKLLSLKFPDFWASGISRAFYIVSFFGLAMFAGKLFASPLFFMFFVILLTIAFLYIWLRYVLDSRDINFVKSFFIKQQV